jgi:hypothetical protein
LLSIKASSSFSGTSANSALRGPDGVTARRSISTAAAAVIDAQPLHRGYSADEPERLRGPQHYRIRELWYI